MAEPLVTTAPERPSEPPGILVVEDDPALARILQRLLLASGYQVWSAAYGAEARALLAHRQPDLILLDLMLPDADGLVLTPLFKALSPAPILILTARAEQVDRVLGLKLGADDFMAKPFDDEELLVRIAALLRRVHSRPPPPARPADRIHVGPLSIARGGGSVTVGSTPVYLTPTEHRLLVVLADHADQVVPRATLLQLVWGYADAGAGHLLDVHLGRLRLKLGRATVRTPAIVTVRGLGFKLLSQSAPPGATDSGGSGSTGGGAAHARLARA